MPDDNKEIIENLKAIKFLLAGIILKRNPNIKEVAKAIGCSDNTLTAIYPERKNKIKEVKDLGVQNDKQSSDESLEATKTINSAG